MSTNFNLDEDRELIIRASRRIDKAQRQIEHENVAINAAAVRIARAKAEEIGEQLAKEYGQEIGDRATEALVEVLGSTPPKH